MQYLCFLKLVGHCMVLLLFSFCSVIKTQQPVPTVAPVLQATVKPLP